MVSWSWVSGADRYEIWRSTSSSSGFSLLESVDGSTTTYEDKDVVAGQDYYYRIKSCNYFGCSGFSKTAKGRASLVPLSPTGLQASQGEYADSVLVVWDPSENATSYEIQRSESREGPYSDLATVTRTVYQDFDVVVETVYWYRVRACNQAGCSPWAGPVSGYASRQAQGGLPAPTGLSASDGDYSGMIVITWDRVQGAEYYEVYRSLEENGDYDVLGKADTTLFEDKEVEANVTYWYKVRACNDEYCGPFSDADSGWAEEDVPPGPPRE